MQRMRIYVVFVLVVVVLGWLLFEFLQPRRACCGWAPDAVRVAWSVGVPDIGPGAQARSVIDCLAPEVLSTWSPRKTDDDA